MNKLEKYDIYILPALVLIAIFTRFFMLDAQSLWLDEIAFYKQIDQPDVSSVYSAVMSIEGHIGPLYHILLHIFTRFFGVSEFALRTPSAFFGVVSVVLLYYLARDLFDEKVARLAALLLALCPLHVWYSQESRMYSLWVMLILACLIVFRKILKEANWRLWLVLIVLASLSVWTFINSVFIFAAMGSYMLLYVKYYRHKVWHFSLAIIIAILTYLPGIIVYLTTKKSNIGS
ncbi:MAG: glycosyltransferase family 39 protein, partial [Lentisphaeraceae bacterium]|nr:glycosyltransferase family 39 protein [Lentisphaeraceae bacterium]